MAQDLSHLSGGQDTWGATRQLAIPANLADRLRSCITISKNGIYVSAGTLRSSTTVYQNQIEQYDLNGTFVRTWQTNASSSSYLNGLASDSDGSIYAFDVYNQQVSKFTSTGTIVKTWGAYGTGDGQFSGDSGYSRSRTSKSGSSIYYRPSNLIAVDSKKNVYVADYGNQRIQIFDSNGNFLRKFGSQGLSIEQFHTGPMAILVSSDDKLLVYERFTSTVNNSSSANHSVMKFDSNGNFVNRISTPQPGYNSVPSVNDSESYNPIFAQTAEGQLIIGEETVREYRSYGDSYWAISGYDPKTLTGIFHAREKNPAYSVSVFYKYAAVSAAFDAQGNLWMVRPDRVECLERQMRFDAYKPSKAVPLPSVLNVSQASGSKVVDIDFLVLDSDSSTVDIGLVALVGGTRSWSSLVVPKKFAAMTPAAGTLSFSGTLSSGTLASGSLAASVSTGKPYRVSWNASADMLGSNFASLSFGVIARDARPEIGVHYVTIPAESGAAAFKMSSNPVQEKDLYDLLMWLLARGDSRVAISGNTVVLTAAGQSYISGAPLPNTTPTQSIYVGYDYTTSSNRYLTVGTPSINGVAHDGTNTTVQGRALAYKLINCRPVSAAEKARAQAGRFNLTSVDDNSVVSLAP